MYIQSIENNNNNKKKTRNKLQNKVIKKDIKNGVCVRSRCFVVFPFYFSFHVSLYLFRSLGCCLPTSILLVDSVFNEVSRYCYTLFFFQRKCRLTYASSKECNGGWGDDTVMVAMVVVTAATTNNNDYDECARHWMKGINFCGAVFHRSKVNEYSFVDETKWLAVGRCLLKNYLLLIYTYFFFSLASVLYFYFHFIFFRIAKKNMPNTVYINRIPGQKWITAFHFSLLCVCACYFFSLYIRSFVPSSFSALKKIYTNLI